MIYWMKPLPEEKIDESVYKPFIKYEWFRNRFMLFVYALQICIVISSMYLKVWECSSYIEIVLIIIITFLIHEFLHLVVIWGRGNISLTHSGIFFWINTDAKLSKIRFWIFMTLPIIMLTITPSFILLIYDESFAL